MTTLVRPGVPVGGFKTVGQIHATNNLAFSRNQNATGVRLNGANSSGSSASLTSFACLSRRRT
jgi:hypothetical protein